MTADEVFAIAAEAVLLMESQVGPDFRFTYDQIWTYLPVGTDVQSTQRSGATRRLIREGFIRRTGGMRNATSAARAGSLTPEYRFGMSVVGERPDVKTHLYDILKDDRTGCYSLLATMPVEEYLNFIEIAYSQREGGIEGQRSPLRTNTAIRIRRTMVNDLAAGAILPPLVVGLVKPPEFMLTAHNLDDARFWDLLDEIPEEDISVIDGMQRTAALMEKRNDPNVLRRPMRVEFWLASNTNSLIYRMLVLNTGQVPWDLRRQIEVIHKSLIKELKQNVVAIELLERDDLRRRARPGQFQANRLVELYMVFGARKERIDTKERLADEFTRLDFIEATSVSLFTRQFFETVQIMVDLDHGLDRSIGEEIDGRFSAGRDLFSSQPACVGFVAASAIHIFGRPGGIERTEDNHRESLTRIQHEAGALITRLRGMSPEEIGRFLDFQTLNEMVTDKKVGKVGDFQREFFLKSVFEKSLFLRRDV
ncbi:MAG TPA: hypothetical protein VH595_17945 [Verrucomicrobiae bacterium]|jgi:hypothetical protein|nr:hypothetical protein [Verrucomicrobiae bacterium]